jgi:hypothetical protein
VTSSGHLCLDHPSDPSDDHQWGEHIRAITDLFNFHSNGHEHTSRSVSGSLCWSPWSIAPKTFLQIRIQLSHKPLATAAAISGSCLSVCSVPKQEQIRASLISCRAFYSLDALVLLRVSNDIIVGRHVRSCSHSSFGCCLA